MSVRKNARNNAGVFVPGLTDSHINEFFLNHKSELYLGKKIKRNYQNIKSICLIDNTLISTIYDPFTKNTHNVSTDFIGIPVNSSEDINPRRTFCTCLQYRLHSSLCQHTAAQLGSAVDRYFSQSILYPYDPIAFNVFIDKNNNIVKYEYQDVTLHQYELPQNTPHPQHIFIETLQAKQLCGDKHVLCLILMYSGNADCRSLICPFCDQKYAWKSKILSFEHYCADGTHYSKSIFQRTPIFGDISSVKFFKSLFNIAEDKGRRTWVDAQNNDRISRKTMTSNFHKIAAVSRIVMNHTVPVGATPYRAVEFDGADLGKRKHGKGRKCKRHWFGKLYERLRTVKGGHLQFTLSGGGENVATYGPFTTEKSSVFSWLYTDTSSFARSRFIRRQRRNQTATHSKGEYVNFRHKTYPPKHKAHDNGCERQWVDVKTQRRIRSGLGFKKDDVQPQFWACYFDWLKTFTDNSTMDTIIMFLTHLAIIWHRYKDD